MLFYFIAAVRTSAIKYSTITVQRKYVGRDMGHVNLPWQPAIWPT